MVNNVTNWLLRAVPKDLAKFVIDEQGELRKHRDCKSVSLATTIYSLLRELKDCRAKSEKK